MDVYLDLHRTLSPTEYGPESLLACYHGDILLAESSRKIGHDRLTAEFQATIAARDAAFQVERDKANERVETAQARMLQETDAAREGQRHAEQQLAKLRQRSEEQQASLTELRLELARHRRELTDAETRLTGLAGITAERDRLALELATVRGQLAGMATALESTEARAMAAEAQLANTRKRRRTE